MRWSPILLLITTLLLTGCQSPPQSALQINGFYISSDSPKSLADWYATNLGLEESSPKNEQLILTGSNIFINISSASSDGNENTIQKTPGFFKIGFKTADIEKIYDQLKRNGTVFRGQIFYDKNLQTKSLVALDPDGNRVQFFEDISAKQLSPYFFSLMVTDFEHARSWCEKTFGFVEIHNLDLPERDLSIRLMKKDNVLLELISDSNLPNTISTSGISSIMLNSSVSSNKEGQLIYNAQTN